MKTMRTAIKYSKSIFRAHSKMNYQSPQNRVSHVIKLDDPQAIG